MNRLKQVTSSNFKTLTGHTGIHELEESELKKNFFEQTETKLHVKHKITYSPKRDKSLSFFFK